MSTIANNYTKTFVTIIDFEIKSKQCVGSLVNGLIWCWVTHIYNATRYTTPNRRKFLRKQFSQF